MLGGLGLTLFLWIIYAISFAIFASRYFHDREAPTDNRVRAICLALFINIITLTVMFLTMIYTNWLLDSLYISYC
jgi:hypothetical protein